MNVLHLSLKFTGQVKSFFKKTRTGTEQILTFNLFAQHFLPSLKTEGAENI